MKDCQTGKHHDCGEHSMLIQIQNPATEFVIPKHNFKEVHQFEFLDAEVNDPFDDDFKITQKQAEKIVQLLQNAFDRRMNVVVHCHAGLCRSGAVAEVGIMMGFTDSGNIRMPNLMVKHALMRALGWAYDSDEKYVMSIDGVVLQEY